MPVTPEYPEMLLDVAEQLSTKLERYGLDREQAAEEAFQLTEFIRKHWGGQDIYVPKGREFELGQKYLRVYEAWRAEGFSLALSRREGLSMQRIRQIVRVMRMKRRQKVESTPLFPESASA